MNDAMKSKAIRAGGRMAANARAHLSGANLTAWAEEQGRRSDAATARGADYEAAKFAAAYVAIVGR